MLYFIKSPYWSRNNKKDTYWGPDKNGYTTLLADAGVYKEEEKVHMESLNSLDRCTFVPITQELWEKAMKQLDKKSNEYRKERTACTDRYKRAMAEIQEYDEKNNQKYPKLIKLAEELGH